MPGDDHCFPDSAMAQMERFVEDFGRMYRERNQLLQQVTRAHHETLLHLSVAADYKDDDTGVHIVRIGYLAEALALLLGQSPAYASMLRKAAPMHDIGKIGTPDHVLKKPRASKRNAARPAPLRRTRCGAAPATARRPASGWRD